MHFITWSDAGRLGQGGDRHPKIGKMAGGLLGPNIRVGISVATRRPRTSYAVDAYPRRAKLGAGSIAHA